MSYKYTNRKDGKSINSMVRRESIPNNVVQNAIDNANEDRVTRQWKRPRNLVRSAALWQKSFGVIDMRELNLVSSWTAYQNVMECLPPEKIISFAAWRSVVKKIMIPIGHAYSVRYIELSRMDTMAMSANIGERSSFTVVNSQCLPLYVWYMYNRVSKASAWKRSAHSIENFMRIVARATPEEIDAVFSVRYDHMWLGKFPREYHHYVWTWNGRVWDGNGNPREVSLTTVHPTIRGLSYEESFIRREHPRVDDAFAADEEEENEDEAD